MNYKRLLLWYIGHVGDCEGTDFLSFIEKHDFYDYRELTQDERDELARLRDIARTYPFDKIPQGS